MSFWEFQMKEGVRGTISRLPFAVKLSALAESFHLNSHTISFPQLKYGLQRCQDIAPYANI